MDLLKNLDLTPSSFPNQLQSPSAEDDVLSSAGRDQIAADEDEGEEHQDEIEWSEGDERHGRLSREGVRSSAAGSCRDTKRINASPSQPRFTTPTSRQELALHASRTQGAFNCAKLLGLLT